MQFSWINRHAGIDMHGGINYPPPAWTKSKVKEFVSFFNTAALMFGRCMVGAHAHGPPGLSTHRAGYFIQRKTKNCWEFNHE